MIEEEEDQSKVNRRRKGNKKIVDETEKQKIVIENPKTAKKSAESQNKTEKKNQTKPDNSKKEEKETKTKTDTKKNKKNKKSINLVPSSLLNNSIKISTQGFQKCSISKKGSLNCWWVQNDKE